MKKCSERGSKLVLIWKQWLSFAVLTQAGCALEGHLPAQSGDCGHRNAKQR